MNIPRLEALEREELERLQVQGLRRALARIAIENPGYHAHLGHIRPHAVERVADIQPSACSLAASASTMGPRPWGPW